MLSDEVVDEQVRAALTRANDIEVESVARIERLVALSQQRDAAGKPTKEARTAQQALYSPMLTSTLPSVTLKRSINPALDTAISEVQSTEVAYRKAVATMRALHARKDLLEGVRSIPRKRTVEDHDLAPEEWKFIREMRARKVPVSAIDQLTEPELDFVATLFIDKQRDMRHRQREGVWWTLVRAGALDISSEAFNEEERAAILAARPKDEENARLAYDALCELAGRKLDVPHVFAQFVLAYAEHSSASEPEGAFEKNVERVHAEQVHADAERLLDLLGLPISELRRAFALMRSPALISFTESVARGRAAAEQRMAAYRALVDRHRPAARQALADRHEVERRKERELVGADALGAFDVEAALERLGAYDEELSFRNASIIGQVRAGTFIEDREAERRRTIDELAARLVDSPEARKAVAEMGISLPELDGPDEERAPDVLAAPSVAPTPAPIPVPEPTLSTGTAWETPPATSVQTSLTRELGLPDDVTPDAAAAYFEIARKVAIAHREWPERTWPFAKAEPSNPASIAAMVSEFERFDRDSGLDGISRHYLALLQTSSIVEANDFLIDGHARELVGEVANGYDFEALRTQIGFPRKSQSY